MSEANLFHFALIEFITIAYDSVNGFVTALLNRLQECNTTPYRQK